MNRFAYFLLAVSALLLCRTSAQLGTCTETEIDTYIRGLPNGTACAAALAQNLIPANDQALKTGCRADCGRPVVEYQLLNCTDDAAFLTVLSCMPTGGSSRLGNICRYSFPDQPDLEAIFTNLTNCATFNTSGECPTGCAAALTATQASVGCCFQFLYSDMNIVKILVDRQLLTQAVAALMINIVRNITLWQVCGVNYPDLCEGEIFQRDPSQIAGICTRDEIDTISEEFSEPCRINYQRSLDDNMLDDVDFKVLCTGECAGKIVDYNRDVCKTELQANLTAIFCLSAGDATLGSHCRYASTLAATVQLLVPTASCFYNNNPPGTCQDSCATALKILSSGMGCCYQNLYNNTYLDYSLFLFFENYNRGSSELLGLLGNPAIWEACNVPLIKACEGGPFDGGVVKFVAPATVLVFMQLVAMLFLLN